MPFTPKTWADGPAGATPITAAELNRIEAGIEEAGDTHVAAADPHPGYILKPLVDAKGDIVTATADNTPARLAVGTNGQVLKANSATATGLEWAAESSGGISATIVDAKGDLIAATAADAVARLAVGTNGQILTADSTQSTGVRWADPASAITQNTQTGSYTLVLGDAGKAVEMNSASATTVTVPPNSSVAFPTGTVLEVHRYGAGTVTLVAGSGVTLRQPVGSALTLRLQYSTAGLRKRGTDEWVVSGDIG